MEFTVNRQTWLRGLGLGSGTLLDSDGKKCCLGFLASACGYDDNEIQGGSFLSYLKNQDKLPELVVNRNFEAEISDLNDVLLSSDILREEAITKMFAGIGIVIKFED